jgi:SAM-dependent methyltransferase
MTRPVMLDLGSGPNPPHPWLGVDKVGGLAVECYDFTSVDPWPFADDSADALRSSHLIEHLPAMPLAGKDLLIRFFEEAWRVAKPGAIFELRWPVPFHPITGLPIPSAWWDPTHYRHIPLQQIWSYFTSEGRAGMGVESYGIRCNWSCAEPPIVRALTEDDAVLEYRLMLRKEPL